MYVYLRNRTLCLCVRARSFGVCADAFCNTSVLLSRNDVSDKCLRRLWLVRKREVLSFAIDWPVFLRGQLSPPWLKLKYPSE